MDPRLVIDLLRGMMRQWRLLVAVGLLAVIAYQCQAIDGLRNEVALANATIAAKVERIDAQALEISVLEFSIQQVKDEAARRQQASAAAVAAAEQAASRQDAEIRRLKAARPATGDDCRDALILLNDYRSSR